MKRRDAIKLLGAAAASSIAWPRTAGAQAVRPVVGFLSSGSSKTTPPLNGFVQGLKAAGFVDGQNVAIEYRWAGGQFDRLPALAEELVKRPAAVIFTVGGNVAALAAKRATSTVPIVFLTGDDPVVSELVASLSRPGGNMTGVTWLAAQLGGKIFELAGELLPSATVIGVLVNPTRPTAEAQLDSVQEAAKATGRTIRILRASTKDDLDAVFDTVAAEHVGALFIAADPLFVINIPQIVALASSRAVPTVYFLREFVDAGGLMSYGASIGDAARLCGDYAGRILNGTKPADLPIQQSTKVELVINLRTAKSLGLTFPITMLGRADAVIE